MIIDPGQEGRRGNLSTCNGKLTKPLRIREGNQVLARRAIKNAVFSMGCKSAYFLGKASEGAETQDFFRLPQDFQQTYPQIPWTA
ncbi:hypothetical protein ACEYYB_06240 [Paracoccus sp. p4-l81]|uniref:hypothetical protein n=1 Tax=unclassified Paracoccus (in: a-proteobacteria) TaxID=2688777 RepID=UPI0035B6BBD8